MKKIIKQPNGKYCIFSTIVDNVIDYDCDEEGLIEAFIEEQKEDIIRMVKQSMKKLEGEFYSSHKYKEMLETILDIHGEKEEHVIKMLLEK